MSEPAHMIQSPANSALDDHALDLLFRAARTHLKWTDRPVSEEALRQLHDVMKWGPTSSNCQPMGILFLASREAKERLRPALSPRNAAKILHAPVTAILGNDLRFYEYLPHVYPESPRAREMYVGSGKERLVHDTALRNGTLQGAYLIIAARALGLDCGPMSGFSNETVDREFFPEGSVKSNFLCSLGYGDPSGLSLRNQRFDFEEVCTVL